MLKRIKQQLCLKITTSEATFVQCVQCTMYIVHCTMHMYIVHCTLYNAHCTCTYNAQCTMHIAHVQCTMYNVQCTMHMYNVQCTLCMQLISIMFNIAPNSS